jgi:hypothetical protein
MDNSENKFWNMTLFPPIPVASRSKALVCGRSLVGIAGSNSARGMNSLVSVVCCHVEVSATGRSLVQRSPAEWGVSECDREATTVRRTWTNGAVVTFFKKKLTSWRILVCRKPI